MLQKITKRKNLLTAVMLLCFCAFTNNVMAWVGSGTSSEPWDISDYSTSGNNVEAYIDVDGSTLYINGSGNMADFWYSTEGETPWRKAGKHTDIQTVIIDERITNIGDRAFQDCSILQIITIPNKVTIIGKQAFVNCTGLQEIIIPPSVTEIEGEAFWNCENLKTVKIKNGTEKLNFEGHYYECTWGQYEEGKCEYSTSWRLDWFKGCKIETLHLGRDYTTPSSALRVVFSDISTLKTLIIGNTVTSIESNAFYNCHNLEDVQLEDGISELSFGGYVFATNSIRNLYMGRNIKENPFYNQQASLDSLTISDKVTSIGTAFYGCNSLKEIHSKNPNPPTAGNNCFYNVYKTCKLYIPQGSLSKYNNVNQPEWKKFFDNNNGFEESALNGIDDVLANQLAIFPNPTKDEIFIKSDLQIGKVEIYSFTGNLLLLENNFDGKISVSALSQGIYLLKIYTNKGLAVSKVVKE